MFRHRLLLIGIILLCWTLFFFMYFFSSPAPGQVEIVVNPTESAGAIATDLVRRGVIRSAWLFRALARVKGIDTQIKTGTYTVEPPITLLRVLGTLTRPDNREERTITILPGWDLRDIAEYLSQNSLATEEEFYAIVGTPAAFTPAPDGGHSSEPALSDEGFLAPNTYRIYADASVRDIVDKLLAEREREFKSIRSDVTASGLAWPEVLTLASIVEREARTAEDRAMVADIFLRRLKAGWALQADSTVHYAVGKKGNIFTSDRDRASENLWNTYKYPGLPPGPICSPSLESISAVLHPTKNDYWYFLTTLDGEMKYAKTIDEHQTNVARYLR